MRTNAGQCGLMRPNASQAVPPTLFLDLEVWSFSGIWSLGVWDLVLLRPPARFEDPRPPSEQMRANASRPPPKRAACSLKTSPFRAPSVRNIPWNPEAANADTLSFGCEGMRSKSKARNRDGKP